MKNIDKNKKDIPIDRQGFTLIEVVVAMFIFVLMMSASSVVFARAFKTYGDARNMQENMENAQYAMNIMAKTFRTSSVADSSGTSNITVFDYSQNSTGDGKCIMYEFIGGSLQRAENSETTLNDCVNNPPSSGSGDAVTSGVVSGNFNSSKSDDTVGSEVVGKITISMTITKGSNTVNMQTTTSLRDYVESGISL